MKYILFVIILLILFIIFFITPREADKENYTFADYDYVTKDGKNINAFPYCTCKRDINIV
jgi:hypothetical protein